MTLAECLLSRARGKRDRPVHNFECFLQYITEYAVPAVDGFFKSIALSHGNSLQDTLRLLTLWFDYGQYTKVYEAVVEGIPTIEIGTWLQVSARW